MRYRRRNLLVATAAGALWLLSASLASASALEDLQRGTAFYLQGASIDIEGHSYGALATNIGKTAGSFDMMLSARALGLDVDQTIFLHGAMTPGGIRWDFDQTLGSPVDLGGNVRVTRVSGTLLGRVTPRYGLRPAECTGPCQYSVDITEMPGGSVTVSGRKPVLGFLWDEDFAWSYPNFRFHVIAGMPQPLVTGVTLAVPSGNLCSSSEPRAYVGRATLSGSPPVGGSNIDIVTSDVARFPPSRVHVGEGATFAEFYVRVPSGYMGTLYVAAAAGGATASSTMTVVPCLPRLDVSYAIDDRVRPACGDACIAAIRTNDSGTILVQHDKAYWLGSPSHGFVSVDKIVGGAVGDARLNAFDEIVGHVGGAPSFRLRSPWDEPRIDKLEDFEPQGIDDRGVLFGLCLLGQKPVGCTELFGKYAEVPSLDSAVDLASATLGGLAVGSTLTPSGVRAFRFDGKAETLGSLDSETRATAINEAGWTVGWSKAKDKKRHAVAFAPGSAGPIVLATPEGWGSTAIGITDDGVVVGNLESGTTKVPVLWSIEKPSQVAYLANVVQGDAAPVEITSVTRGGRIVARAKRGGVDTVVVFERK